MSRIARYIVFIDRDLYDADGSGTYHDGNGADAAEQLSKELQEGWDNGGIAGHFRVIARQVYEDETAMPGGYVGRDMPTRYGNDPDYTPKPKRFQVETILGGNDNLPDFVSWAVIDTEGDPEKEQVIKGLFLTQQEADTRAENLNKDPEDS